MGSATRFGFHSHADDDGQHGHHHSFPALVDLHGASGSDPTGVDDPSAALLHGHDFASAATLTVAAPVPCLACAPAARVLPPPASPPDARASAPPIRPPIA